MASAYGWGHRYVERELTDELLTLYLDAGIDRLGDLATARFNEQIEAVRAGWIFGQDQRQYDRWRSSVARRSGQRPDGKPLGALVRDLGGQIIGIQVVRGELEFRN